MNKHTLTVTRREVLGKNSKKLRRVGILPANIYGRDIASEAVQVALKDFQGTFKATGETGLLYLKLDGKERPVLIHNVQLDYITQLPVHADFYQVNLKEKVKTMVPVVLVGEAQAVTDKVGTLLQTLNEIEVEALPTDLPEHFEVDVTKLAAVNDQITIEDLKKINGVEILTEPTQTIVKISELVEPEPEPVVETPAEGETAAAEGEEKADSTSAEATANKEEK
jgi:large subunit ribosomal protein L25